MFDYTKNPTIVTESLMIAGGGGAGGGKGWKGKQSHRVLITYSMEGKQNRKLVLASSARISSFHALRL